MESQITPDKYPELLKRDLAENGYYGSLNTLQGALRFDQFQRLFDCLKPSDVSGDYYCVWLKYIRKIESYSKSCVDEGIRLFMHMWTKEGFDSHRALLLNEEMRSSPVFQGRLLVPLINRGCVEPVWAVLSKANSDQIKEFMDSRQAEHIRSVLEKRDVDSLNKFLSYGKSTVEECTSLTEVKLSKACEQLELGN
ncbi:hypothetical protein [Wolbachia endosymbiont (group A) of Epagoge grotiana]|uniref:hypothetical protein n=1 Tax=Wolbachia endosymbiont (group A) of Epagoge grotiana TaxID=2954006 RepID=UPI00222EFF67|nr:hypothetical protein [Wolbachia endosymbiont (group A) of Epagoge grotiana]